MTPEPQPETITAEEMAHRMGMSPDVFAAEVAAAGKRPSRGPNRAQRRAMARADRKRGR